MKSFLRQIRILETAPITARHRRQEGLQSANLLRSIMAGLPLALALLLPQIATAEQIPTTPNGTWTKVSNTVATKTTPGGLTMTVTLTGAAMTFGAINNTALQTTKTITTPTLPSTTNGIQIIATSPSSCVAASLTCGGYGTISFSFTDPNGKAIKVKNPVLHVARLGGWLSVKTGSVTKSAVHGSILDLTTSGVTLGAPSTGSRALLTTGTQIKTDLAVFPNLAASGSSMGDCIAAPAAAQAGCGSVPVTGLFSSLSFNESMHRRNVTANALPGWIEGSSTAADGLYFTISFDEDYGDAPSSYDVGSAASHIISDLTLGAAITADNTTTFNGSSTGTAGLVATSPNAVATSANNNGLNGDGTSDDGVPSFPVLRTNSSSYILPVNIAGASNAGQVCGWIDFNNNKKFDSTEMACTNFAIGATSVNLNWATIPAGMTIGNTYARIRATYDTRAAAQTPTGRLSSGEVEDYQVKIEGVPDLKITKSHAGSFMRGQNGATYTINVNNLSTATGSTSGLVTVTDTLPSIMTATAISGPNWACTLSPLACTRSDTLAIGASYEPITVTVNVGNPLILPPSSATNTAAVTGGGDATPANNSASDVTALTANTFSPDLIVTKTHVGNFIAGQTGVYTLSVKNIGTGGTNLITGTTVIDNLPTGLTVTTVPTAAGWTCTLPTSTQVKCTYPPNIILAGASYPSSIPITVNVATNAPSTVVNSATVSGGGETNAANSTTTDSTIIESADLTITKVHNGTFTQQQQGATYTLTANNIGNLATNGLVTVTDTLPVGLTATAIDGVGWSCTLSPLACTRSDALAAGTSYPPITVTVDVIAAGSLTNNAAISGGGQFNTANDTATDTLTSVALPTPPVTISGTLWDDANNSAASTFANIFSAGEAGTSGSGLYAVLVDASDTVVASAPIAADGTYTLTKVPANQAGLKIRLTTAAGVVAKPAPLTEIYADWVATSPTETPTFTTGTSDITNQDFGLEQLPNSFDVFATDAVVNPNGNVQVVVPNLNGSDAENGNLGSGNNFRILTLPSNGTLYYAGSTVMPGQLITGYDPTLLKVDPNNGAVSIDFTYAAIDAAGQESVNPGAVSMLFLGNSTDFKIIKRITAINGVSTINPSDNLTHLDQVLDNSATPNDDPGVNWPPAYLVGAYNGGKIKPGDELEYTVYFLNAKGANANTIKICDRIIGNQTYKAGSMELRLGNATTSIPLTDGADPTTDRAQFYPLSSSAPTGVNGCNLITPGAGVADNGTWAVDITGAGSTVQPDIATMPSATAPGVPTTSYGLIRFKTIVKP